MNFNGSEVNESPCKYCKYDGYQNHLDSACYTCCFNGDLGMPSWFRNRGEQRIWLKISLLNYI